MRPSPQPNSMTRARSVCLAFQIARKAAEMDQRVEESAHRRDATFITISPQRGRAGAFPEREVCEKVCGALAVGVEPRPLSWLV